MIEIEKNSISGWENTFQKVHTIQIDTNLDCIILINTPDSRLGELLFTKILDSIIDSIHPKTVYKDFQNALESVNNFMSSWSENDSVMWELDIFIGIQDIQTLYFSTVWRASSYLINNDVDIVEVTDRTEIPKKFHHILSGDLMKWETILIASRRVLDPLSKDDLREVFLQAPHTLASSEMLEHSFRSQDSSLEISYVILKNLHADEKVSSAAEYYTMMKHFWLKLLDNNFTKKSLGYVNVLRTKVSEQSHSYRQYLYLGAFFLSACILYIVISSFFSLTTSTQNTEILKEDLILAQQSIVTASKNMNNPDIFNLNMDIASQKIDELENEQIFLSDLEKLQNDMSILRKQFDGIESFIPTEDTTLVTFDIDKNISALIEREGRLYAIHSRSITGPIWWWFTSEEYIFEDLQDDDMFIDAEAYDGGIMIISKKWKVIKFSDSNFFSFVDVLNQDTWEKSPTLWSYGSNIYMISDSKNQILMHRASGTAYAAGVSYLKEEDASAIEEIYSIAIDWGIYILNNKGEMLKLFRSPTYRLESLSLNSLPKNYDFSDFSGYDIPSIRAGINLSNVYMLYKNKVLVFEANSNRYQDTKFLIFRGQIEAQGDSIEDFYVSDDGEIFLATESGIYKINFDIIDEKLVLR